jgi:hypothetical protein
MPIDFRLKHPPFGYVLSVDKEGGEANVLFREFTSSEDGQQFIQRLEGLPTVVLQTMSISVRPSQVDHMLVIFHRDGTGVAYVNELSCRGRLRASRAIEVGEAITKNDVVDVEALELGVDIPKDAGFMYIFSWGWRKGLFYDFGPISGPSPQPREFNVATLLGQAYCHVLFQERFSLSDRDWAALFEARWFPFAGLKNQSIERILNQIRNGCHPDDELEALVSEVRKSAPQMLGSWRGHTSFAPHIHILERAIERFLHSDFVSCTALLFPRIEGILRTHHTSLGVTNRPRPDNLTRTAVLSKLSNAACLLMPRRFEAFLREVYFANFDPSSQDIDVSRHSVAHGVASATQFNQKSAMLGLLVVHQLFYFLENKGDWEVTAD